MKQYPKKRTSRAARPHAPRACPSCGSRKLVHGMGAGLSKPKPYVQCARCGALLSWG